MNKLDKLIEALTSVTDKVYHFQKNGHDNEQYLVWSEEYIRNSYAKDEVIHQVIVGTIDFFTKTEFDPMVSDIEKALKSASICYRMNSIQNEDETGFIHYEWVFEIG
ncbi:hypothetical protein [Anaerorhabdus sp.]|uniref:hypothetical protein n=1 Tax=Anaerorhabdus sp. TaxID=1872524 RepID=UPI002B1F6D90|nr:hypothetical protein [Anaerorhabdus sp.]MEA4876024.1 hypothetical protein [Anaerorhabdus sp.]